MDAAGGGQHATAEYYKGNPAAGEPAFPEQPSPGRAAASPQQQQQLGQDPGGPGEPGSRKRALETSQGQFLAADAAAPAHPAGAVAEENGGGEYGDAQEGEHQQRHSGEPEALETEADGKKRWPGWPGDSVFRLLVSESRVGGIIGRRGEYVKRICDETKARVKIVDPVPGIEDRVVLISGREDPSAEVPPAVVAVLRVHRRAVEATSEEEILASTPEEAYKGHVAARLLVPATQAGSLIGRQGAVIKDIQDRARAHIRILSIEDVPPCSLEDDRVVEISGEYALVHNALKLVVLHLRRFLCDHSVLPLFENNVARSQYQQAMSGGGPLGPAGGPMGLSAPSGMGTMGTSQYPPALGLASSAFPSQPNVSQGLDMSASGLGPGSSGLHRWSQPQQSGQAAHNSSALAAPSLGLGGGGALGAGSARYGAADPYSTPAPKPGGGTSDVYQSTYTAGGYGGAPSSQAQGGAYGALGLSSAGTGGPAGSLQPGSSSTASSAQGSGYDSTALLRASVLKYGRETSGSTAISATPVAPVVTQVSATMQIPLSYAEAIIGTAGNNISFLRKTSGAAVTITEGKGSDGQLEMTVEVRGSAPQVHTAQQLIEGFMNSFNQYPTPTSTSTSDTQGGYGVGVGAYDQRAGSDLPGPRTGTGGMGGSGYSGYGSYGGSYGGY